jgi:hypothetical protein
MKASLYLFRMVFNEIQFISLLDTQVRIPLGDVYNGGQEKDEHRYY